MESKPRLGYDSKSLAKVLRSWIYTPLSLAISAFDLRRHETQLTPGGSTEPFRRKLLLLAPDQQLPARMRSGLHALHPWFSCADGNPGDRVQSSRHPGPQGEQTASRAGSAHSCGLQNQLESLLEEAHIKLSSLVSDLLGLSAQRMLKAIPEGETNPAALAALADERLRATPEQLCDALGACTELDAVYRRLLKMALEECRLIDEQIN